MGVGAMRGVNRRREDEDCGVQHLSVKRGERRPERLEILETCIQFFGGGLGRGGRGGRSSYGKGRGEG